VHLTDDQIIEIAKHVQADDLPGDLPEIAELVGTYKALKLGHAVGFGRVYLHRWNDNLDQWSRVMHLVVDAIGRDDAQCLAENFDGAHVDIPKCDAFWTSWRNRLICSTDESQFVLGRKHGLSDRWIREIQKRGRVNENQQDLF